MGRGNLVSYPQGGTEIALLAHPCQFGINLGHLNLSNRVKRAVHLPRNHVSQSTISRDNRSRASISASPTPMAASTRWVGHLGTVMSFKIDDSCTRTVH